VDFDAVADELFVLAPTAFIERRNTLAELARSEGDAQLAARIKALRRPTVSAALVNALVRERGEVIAGVLTLGADLRDAQARGDGVQMRALAGRRQELMRLVDRHVAELANERGLTATRAVERDVHATMLAALSDTRAEAIVRGGRLESALNDGTFAGSAAAATGRASSPSDSNDEPVGSASTRRIESAERKLKEASASAAAGDDAAEKLAAAVHSAQREHADLKNQLEETLERARSIERDLATADRTITSARDAHADAVRHAKALGEAAAMAKTQYERETAAATDS
jgi:hypothetical protein